MKKLVSMLLCICLIISSLMFTPTRIAGAGEPEPDPDQVSYDLNDIVANGNMYVAVGDYGTIKVSVDNGQTWKDAVSNTQENLISVIFDGKQFVVAGTTGAVITSTDALTWTFAATGVTNKLNAIVFNGMEYAFVGDGGFIMTSPDLVSFKVQTSGVEVNLFDIVWNKGLYLAVGDFGTILKSSNGIDWSPNTISGGPAGDTTGFEEVAFNSIMWDGFQYIIAGSCGAILTSQDGLAWVPKPSPKDEDFKSIAYDGKDYIVMGSYGVGFTSPDLMNWAPLNVPFPEVDYRSIIWYNGRFIVVGTYTTILFIPNPFAPWWWPWPPFIFDHLYDIVWSPERSMFVTVGTRGIIQYSPDGYNWFYPTNYIRVREHLYGVSWSAGLGMFMAVGDRGVVLYSYNGSSDWFQAPRPTRTKLNCVTNPKARDALGNIVPQFLVVGDYARVCVTGAGFNWSFPLIFDRVNFNGTTCNQNGTATIVGDYGRFYSADGYQLTNWVYRPLPTIAKLLDVNWDNSDRIWPAVGSNYSWNPPVIATMPYSYTNPAIVPAMPPMYGVTSDWDPLISDYIAVGAYGFVQHSNDGYNWMNLSPYPPFNLNDVTYSPQRSLFVAVGDFLRKIPITINTTPTPTPTPTPSNTPTPTPTPLATAAVTLEIFGNDDIGGTGTGTVSISPASLEGTSSVSARYGVDTYPLTFPINTMVTFRGDTTGSATCTWDGYTNPFSVQVVGGETFRCNFIASNPTFTPTPTPSYTPTPSPTPTPTPVSGSIRLQFFNGNTAATTNTIYANFKLINISTSAISLSNVKMRYYFTKDGTQSCSLACDYSTVGSSNITGTFGTISRPLADTYCEVGFTTGAGSLIPNGSVEVKTRIWKSDWSNFNQLNDYSFNPTAANYVNWDRVTGYVSGVLNWGIEP